LALSPSKVGTLVPTLLEYSSSVSVIFDQRYTPREASIAIVLKRVVKSFLLGRTLDLNLLMIVTTVLTIAFAIECFYTFIFLDCEQSVLTLPHHLLHFYQAKPLGSDACYGSVRPRNSLSNYLIR